MMVKCNICDSMVEPDGTCRHGHRASDSPDLVALRDEVERAFEEARAQIADVLNPPARRAGPPPPPPPVPGSQAEARSPVAPPPPPVPAPPVASLVRVPPPAPPPPTVEDVLSCHWGADSLRALAMPPPPGRDPIAAFAPAPRMDWGPARTERRERKAPFGRRIQPEGS